MADLTHEYKRSGHADMSDRPIIMDRESVRSLLAGRKTQTRRPVRRPWDDLTIAKHDPHCPGFMVEAPDGVDWPCFEDQHGDWHLLRSPFGAYGDRLWVRETWAPRLSSLRLSDMLRSSLEPFDYLADHAETMTAPKAGYEPRWYPSIHMPREACRMHLSVKRVWVERVQVISAADIEAEGIRAEGAVPVGYVWRDAWNAHYGAGPYDYDNNPLVWACEFEVER